MEGLIATWYARANKGVARGYWEHAQEVTEGLPSGSRVLEVAPGPGYLAIELAKVGDYHVSGLDISESFVRIARENAKLAGVAIEFRQGNASEMPYTDESFDLVVCCAAFKNFADPIGALNEIHRVLKPGGRASIDDLNGGTSIEDIDAVIKNMRLSRRFDVIVTRLVFRFILLKRAYGKDAFERMASKSRFGGCELVQKGASIEMRLTK